MVCKMLQSVLCLTLVASVFGKDEPLDNNVLPDVMKQVDVNKTIEEVQAILLRNSSLPRLTRGEILALLQDVTKSLPQRKEKNNNLLLVMPVNSNSSNLENLYSVTPVTRLVRTDEKQTETEVSTKPYNKRVTQKPSNKRRRRPSTTEHAEPYVRLTSTEQPSSTTQVFSKAPSFLAVTTNRPLFLNYVTRKITTTSPRVKGQSFDLPDSIKNNLQTFDISDQFESIKTDSNLESKSNTGENKQKNSQNIPNLTVDVSNQDTKFGMGAVSTAIRVSEDIPTADQKRPVFNYYPTMISLTDPNDGSVEKSHYGQKLNKNASFSSYNDNEQESGSSSIKLPKNKIKPTTPSSYTSFPSLSVASESLTPDMKNILISLGLLNPDTGSVVQDNPATPEQLDVSNRFNLKPSPTVDPESYIKFKPIPVGDSNTNRKANNIGISSDMKDFLASYGLISEGDQRPKTNEEFKDSDYSHRSQKALSFNREYINNETSNEFLVDLASLEQDPRSDFLNDSLNNPFNDSTQNFSLSMDMLSDDMKDVLQNLGIIEETMALRGTKVSKQHVFNPAVHTALLKDTTEAKRIKKLWNAIQELSKDNKTQELSQDEIKMQLDNITTSVLTANQPHESFIMKIINQNKQRVKLAGEHKSNSIEKLKNEAQDFSDENKDPIKSLEELENGEIESFEELNKTSGDSNPSEVTDFKDMDENLETLNSNTNLNFNISSSGSLNHVMDPPDPLSSHELSQLYETHQKNEVKRQQPSSSPETSTEVFTETSFLDAAKTGAESTTSSPATDDSNIEATTTNGEEEKAEMPSENNVSPSIDQLADSFGGGSVASAPPKDEELPAATLRPNGLYFYVDWNTFLNVGEEDKKPVNLRFAPKVGNPRLFLPVNVP